MFTHFTSDVVVAAVVTAVRTNAKKVSYCYLVPTWVILLLTLAFGLAVGPSVWTHILLFYLVSYFSS